MENGQQEHTEVIIIVKPPKEMGKLTFCDSCGKYVAESCTEQTYPECAK